MHALDDIRAYITAILADPEVNRLSPDDAEPAWGPPLLGVSDGDDPLYEEIKKDIGPFHWTPRQIFALSFPGDPVWKSPTCYEISGPSPHRNPYRA